MIENKSKELAVPATRSKKNAITSSSLSGALDLLRWLAALLVVSSHIRNIFFVDYQSVIHPSVWEKLFYFSTGLGHEAVMVFFVLSGYLVGGRSWERMRQGTFHIKDYAIDRFSRIYSVFFVAIFLGLAMDWIGINIFASMELYDHPSQLGINVLRDGAASRMKWEVVAGNLFMLQTILVPVAGSNSPLWSLANECWYYMLFPVFLGAWYMRNRARYILLFVGFGLIYWLPLAITEYFIIWLLGATVIMLRNSSLPLWLALMLFAGAITTSRFHFFNNGLISDIAVASGVALLIQSMQGRSFRMIGSKLHRKLADFSYSLYLCHLPFLLLIAAGLSSIFERPLRAQPSYSSYGQFLIVMLVIYCSSYLLAWMTEFRMTTIRNYLKSRL